MLNNQNEANLRLPSDPSDLFWGELHFFLLSKRCPHFTCLKQTWYWRFIKLYLQITVLCFLDYRWKKSLSRSWGLPEVTSAVTPRIGEFLCFLHEMVLLFSALPLVSAQSLYLPLNPKCSYQSHLFIRHHISSIEDCVYFRLPFKVTWSNKGQGLLIVPGFDVQWDSSLE